MRDYLNEEGLIEYLKEEELDEYLIYGLDEEKLEDNLLDDNFIEKIKKMKKNEKKMKMWFNFLLLNEDQHKKCFKKLKKIEKMIKIGFNFRNSLANDIGGRREFWGKGFRWK